MARECVLEDKHNLLNLSDPPGYLYKNKLTVVWSGRSETFNINEVRNSYRRKCSMQMQMQMQMQSLFHESVMNTGIIFETFVPNQRN